MALLNVGTDLSNRKVTLSLPSGTTISEYKVVVRGNANCFIYEDSTGVHYTTPNGGGDIGSNGTTINQYFGVITEVDETAISYPFLTRTDNEKVYALSEDYGRVEIVTHYFQKLNVSVPANSAAWVNIDISGFEDWFFLGVREYSAKNIDSTTADETLLDIIGMSYSATPVGQAQLPIISVLVRNLDSVAYNDVWVEITGVFIAK